MKNTQRQSGGFTLIEVIVVAVIIAVLAGVAIPVYIKYIENSRTNSAANAAGAIASFCSSCLNSDGTIGVSADGKGQPAAISDGKVIEGNDEGTTTIVCSDTEGSDGTSGLSIKVPKNIDITFTDHDIAGNASVMGKYRSKANSGKATKIAY